jgi:hypothetical protein
MNCLTNRGVYGLLSNQSDLMKVSKTIEKQLNRPNEHMCTSIDLSMSLFFIYGKLHRAFHFTYGNKIYI